VPGPTLRELLKQRGALPEAEAISLAAQVADGLTAAHRAGLVHCDIKPANVLLDADGRAKVADFGIARAVSMEVTTHTTSVLGTVHYLSPEQAQRQPTDARSDAYSLGAVLYELLTGGPPFAGNSAVAVAIQHVQAPPPSPRAIRPEITHATEAVVLRALAKRPAERFQSAADMLVALKSVQTQGATMPLPTQPLPHSAGASPNSWAGGPVGGGRPHFHAAGFCRSRRWQSLSWS
jgi:serine/threonine-protein kinase